MPFIGLTGGAYQARSLIAAAQRCVNLFPEPIPRQEGEPWQVAHYCTPGLTLVQQAPQAVCRCLYTASTGVLYGVFGQEVLAFSSAQQWTYLGTFAPTEISDAVQVLTPVSMCDNLNVLLICDGSVDGWFVDITQPLSSQVLTRLDYGINTGWLGSDFINFQDTFFIMNSPGTEIFYISLSNINAATLTEASTVYTALLAPTGTGYAVNDVLTLAGTGGATITVGSVDQGVITGFSLTNVGSVTAQPTNPVAGTGGSGNGAMYNLTWIANGPNFNVEICQSVPTGTHYTAGDVLTLTGTGGAQITVNTVDSPETGVITGYGVTNGGAVTSQPAQPVPVTGGTGLGATFGITFEANIGGFDATDFAGMTAQANKLVAAVSMHRNLWLIGTTSYEVWINSGGDGTTAGSFPFSIYPEAFGNWGCVAKYSIVTIFNQIFWLSQDKFGIGMVMRAEGLQATRVSTHAIEYLISQYPTMTDCQAMAYQQQGHQFVLFTFPSANNYRGATWVYDITTGEWHERVWIDSNGLEYRHPANAIACAYDQVWVGEWRNSNLYTFDLNNYTDVGNPVVRKRSFPHQIDLEASRRISYQQLIAQMQVGSATEAGPASYIVSTEFQNPNGTALADYYNINDLGATFIDSGAVPAIIMNDAIVATEAGSVTYTVASVPTQADYVIGFAMVPDSYSSVPANGAFVSVVGRAYGVGGYQAAIGSDGTEYDVVLNVLDTATSVAVALGVLSAGAYDVQLIMVGTSISVTVYRTIDGMWMNSLGSWVPSPATAIAIADDTWTLPGVVLVGGEWE